MKSICIDFDGVLHLYPTGQPVAGAIPFLQDAVKEFDVFIFSSRSSSYDGINGMIYLLEQWGIDGKTLSQIRFPTFKPPAFIFLDDRAICFKGIFPTNAELNSFDTWNEHDPSRQPTASAT